ncbi:MAG: Hsp20/alpha crystallin family protein [Chitinophagales bacterium]|nr:Hsp20/alpha crystallin family protein [Chitinophagales bacterium]
MTLVRNRFRQNAFPALFDDAFFKDFFDATPRFSKDVPAVNIKETDNAFLVELAAPGLSKGDFNISVENNVLTISSESKREDTSTDKDEKYTRREFSYSSFSRSFTLDEQHIDVEAISANYESGVLKLSIPKKTEPEKLKKTIEIQ